MKNVLDSFNIAYSRSKMPSLCHACAFSKSHSLPFSDSLTSYTVPLQLIVVDVCSPTFKVSCNGYKFYISFVDVFSRYTWVYFLQTKSESFQAFLLFKTHVEKLFGTSILRLQTDGGRDFQSFIPFLKTHSIEHHVSCPYTSQQNGIVERKHS